MPLTERLGSFYLGKEYDLATKKVLDRPVNYDSRDLTTHAVCVGMTGSGKTGLCIDLLEEAAIDNVPAIIIDPKGDITNLLLTFPDLRPEDFLPWINADDARRKGMEPQDYAVDVAKSWREGLASWDQGSDRIRMLKSAADFVIFTPGSEAGKPISILSSFQAPTLDWETEAETLREMIQGTVSALLGLVGIQADPVRSREHILLSNILEHSWRAGEDLDVAKLILAVQTPPFRKLGVFDVDTFYPQKERFELAMALNSIIASPSFAAWLEGEPLDIASLLHTPEGKPRHSIFYIAHLGDAERMFFVTILLEQVISWMRSQPGTTSLRALVYMDEVFGFFPPVAEPPSKRPMLTLLKQARAFGVGMILTTQNPADIDYKGLTNAGTWFIGKLQAERDKARLMEGLESALAETGSLTDTKVLDKTISSLDSRIFLLHNVHADRPVVFSTRWAMSYLRGPLTRQQVKQLVAERAPAAESGVPVHSQAGGTVAVSSAAAGIATASSGLSAQPPVLPPGMEQVYLPVKNTASTARTSAKLSGDSAGATQQQLVYEPGVLGLATVKFVDRKRGIEESKDYALLLPVSDRERLISWQDAVPVDVGPRDLGDAPEPGGLFTGTLPSGVSTPRQLQSLAKDLSDHLYRNESLAILSNPTLKLDAKQGESERDFNVRCQQVAREARDAAVDKLRDKFDVKIQRLQDRLAREEQELTEDKAQYTGRMGEEILSGLASVVGALGVFGRKSRSLSGLSTAASKRRISGQAKADIAESEAEIARLKADIDGLQEDLESETKAITEQLAEAEAAVEQTKIAPRRADVDVQLVAFAWAPGWEFAFADERGRERTETVPAYPLIQQA